MIFCSSASRVRRRAISRGWILPRRIDPKRPSTAFSTSDSRRSSNKFHTPTGLRRLPTARYPQKGRRLCETDGGAVPVGSEGGRRPARTDTWNRLRRLGGTGGTRPSDRRTARWVEYPESL